MTAYISGPSERARDQAAQYAVRRTQLNVQQDVIEDDTPPYAPVETDRLFICNLSSLQFNYTQPL